MGYLHLKGNLEDALATLAGWLTSLAWCMYIQLHTHPFEDRYGTTDRLRPSWV